MFALALSPCDEPARESGTLFGDYEILHQLGIGGSGVVFRAHHAGLHRTVALKLMRDAQFATDREIQRFRDGAAAAAGLDHPHIVPIFHVGERDGQPFFTMRLIEGENLRKAMPRLRESTQSVARTLAKVARAVHFAHQRGILHRDLKPANILLDESGEPYVADFGLAKRLDARAMASISSDIVGTLEYMSPEQAEGVSELSVAADVYALGVILYELLTGKLPLPRGSMFEQLSWLTSSKLPRLPRELVPDVDRNLEVICLRCLEKNAENRYQTAEELAVALERTSRLEGDEPLPPWHHRLEAWLRRHPRGSLALAGLILVLAVALLSGWWLWRKDQRLVRDTLDTNTFIAGSQAGAALAQLREYAERVAQSARDPELVKLLAEGRIVEPALPLKARLGSYDNLALFNSEAYIIAEWPQPDPIVYARSYGFRDYFSGARYLAEHRLPGGYVARAFRSETQGRLVFAFSAPVLDERGVAVGVLMATLNAKSVFGAVRMEDSAGGLHVTSALIGPRGPDRDTKPGALRADFTFLAHPGLPDGREYRVSSAFSAKLRRFGASAPPGQQFALEYVPPVKVLDYEDAVPGFEGKWLAAFAPVGNTGFAVLVQTRRRRTLNYP
jgi:serine/threonine-protein kinase